MMEIEEIWERAVEALRGWKPQGQTGYSTPEEVVRITAQYMLLHERGMPQGLEIQLAGVPDALVRTLDLWDAGRSEEMVEYLLMAEAAINSVIEKALSDSFGWG